MDDGYHLRSDPAGLLRPVLQVPRKWGLFRRFGVVLLPFALICLIIMGYGGYKVLEPYLTRLVSGINLIKARVQARNIEELLQSVAVEMLHTAGDKSFAALEPGNGRERNAPLTPQDLEQALWRLNFIWPDLVVEAAYKPKSGEPFAVVRSNGEIMQIDATRLRAMHSSPLDNSTLNDAALINDPGKIGFLGSMRVNYSEHKLNNEDALYVMRLDLPVFRGEGDERETVGILVFGVNMFALRDSMLNYFGPDSPTNLSWQDGEISLEYFFDLGGWVLFQAENTTRKEYPLSTDVVRMGMNGDFGRTGLDSAFRPDVSHGRFWKMVKSVREGVHGETAAFPGRYSFDHALYDGYLCYAPVYLRAGPWQDPVVIGGVASIESSNLLRVVKSELLSTGSYLLLFIMPAFSLALYLVCRILAKNLSGQNKQIRELVEHGRFQKVRLPFFSKEVSALQMQVQQLCGKYFMQAQELSHLDGKLKGVLSRQRVSLPKLASHRPSPEINGRAKHFVPFDDDLLGQSKAVEELREKIRRAANSSADVLVWGETGTGKELTATAIHKLSAREKEPFLSINCGALDENLLLDALFGHVKGAFSDAKSDRKGAFVAASGGTLLLDEIGTASPRVQQAMLRALSTRSLRPLGSDSEVYFDTRIVAATNVDLRECVKSGAFREDLYYRLAVIVIETPTLRQRKDDIPLLAEYFLSQATIKLGHMPASLSQGALDALTAYSWPGNVRELKNCLTQALTFVEGDLIFTEQLHLGENLVEPVAERECLPDSEAWTEPDASTEELAGVFSEASAGPEGMPAEAVKVLPGQGFGNLTDKESENERGLSVGSKVSGSAEAEGAGNGWSIPDAPMTNGLNAPGAVSHERTSRDSKIDMINARLEQLLNERQMAAWSLILSKRSISRSEYQNFLESEFGVGLPLRTAQYDLQDFVRKGVLIRVGGGPSTRYIVAKEFKNTRQGE